MSTPAPASIAPAAPQRPMGSRAREGFVLCAMLLVSAALGVGLYSHLAVAAPHAIASAVLVWSLLALLHLLVRRVSGGGRAARAADEKLAPNLSRMAASPMQQRRARVAAAKGGAVAPPSAPPPLPQSATRATANDGAKPARRPLDELMAQSTPSQATASADAATQDARPAAGFGWDLRPGAGPESLSAGTKPAVFPPLDHVAAASRPAIDPRARTPRADSHKPPPLPGSTGGSPATTAGTVAEMHEVARQMASIGAPARSTDAPSADAIAKTDDFESMQEFVDQIARQLNTQAGVVADPERTEPSPAAQDDAEQVITRSIEALKAAGGAMRNAPQPQRPATAGAGPLPPFVRPPAKEPQKAAIENPAPKAQRAAGAPDLTLIADAIAAERFEVYLESVFGLADRKARHFAASVRVKTADGLAHDADECAAMYAGNGIAARLDAAKFARVARIAGRLSTRGASAALFCKLAPESLVDDNFLDTCAGVVSGDAAIGRQLVLSFRQTDVRGFTAGHWETLATLTENGLRFAVDGITDLAMDFEVLKTRGFAFAKIEATTLFGGLQAHDGVLQAVDANRHLADNGLSVIIGGIDDHLTLARALGLGSPYGQGEFFASPRAVKIDLGSLQDAAA